MSFTRFKAWRKCTICAIVTLYIALSAYSTALLLFKRLRSSYVKDEHNIFPSDNVLVARTLTSVPRSQSQSLPADDKYWSQWIPLNFSANRSNFLARPSNFVYEATVPKYTVDIWSNNGLGDYLWLHLLNGHVSPRPDRLWLHGEKIISSIKLRYRMGNKLDAAYIPDTTEHLLLVLNTRNGVTRQTTLSWLSNLNELPRLQNLALLLIGDEFCHNDWILPYIARSGNASEASVNQPEENNALMSKLRFVYLVYDSNLVDNVRVFQFPLGVATYRNFPLPSFSDVVVPGSRSYVCNFMGTVYPNSSRETLVAVLNTQRLRDLCFLKIRESWLEHETEEGLDSYMAVLRSSDLTLCPAGQNPESYRIYEAMSLGSVPVLELAAFSGNSSSCDDPPFRLLRRHGCPFLFVKDWHELPAIIEAENRMSLMQKEKRRSNLMTWYSKFRSSVAAELMRVLKLTFFTRQASGNT